MATIPDLTFQQVNNASNAQVFEFNEGVITLNVNILTSDDYDSLDSFGVSELLFKLRKFAGMAATTANANVADHERILSFPPFTYSPPDTNGYVGVTQIQTFSIPLDSQTVKATNPAQPVALPQ